MLIEAETNRKRFLHILSHVPESELQPFLEQAEKDVEKAVGAFYASQTSQDA